MQISFFTCSYSVLMQASCAAAARQRCSRRSYRTSTDRAAHGRALVRPAWASSLGLKSRTRPAAASVSRGQGYRREAESEGSRRKNAAPMNRNHMRQGMWVRLRCNQSPIAARKHASSIENYFKKRLSLSPFLWIINL